MRSVFSILLLATFFACTTPTQKRRGPLLVDDLLSFRTPSQLEQEFGKSSIREITSGEDEKKKVYEGFYLFPATDSSVEFMKGEDEFIAVRIRSPKWKTKNGVQMGMSMKDLIALNGVPFEIDSIGRATLPYQSSWGSQMFARFDGMNGFFAANPTMRSVNTSIIDPKDQEGLYLIELIVTMPEKDKPNTPK